MHLIFDEPLLTVNSLALSHLATSFLIAFLFQNIQTQNWKKTVLLAPFFCFWEHPHLTAIPDSDPNRQLTRISAPVFTDIF